MRDLIFEKIINGVLHYEGGFQNDEDDNGNWTGGFKGLGELKGTNGGISSARYPKLDIISLTVDQIKQIYYEDFWLKFDIPRFDPIYQYYVFDMYVNHSPKGVGLILQRSVNSSGGGLIEDGVFGNKSWIQFCITNPQLDTIRKFRIKYYLEVIKSDPKLIKYLHGWVKRAVNL